ncbi:ABC transporter ATP-binding protein [Numidum massiliense]|uniref:ABC transporter ATP-binding protein n=1 Tax=Numidum massiliense TaxID=1522315 RepID=UPI0006D577AD|nr:ABC transporter ATP-binding protein [Numidum massiliense]
MANIIDLQNVSWQRDDRYILHAVDWSVRRGEHWALIGPNGAGKTALLNIVSGYMWPSRGSVAVLGKSFGHVDLRELRQSIGWVSATLFDRFYRSQRRENALNVVLSGKHASIGVYEAVTEEDRQTALELLQLFGCEQLADKLFHTCSQGEKQRLVLARALMSRPQLLILDEPCTGLDLTAREQLLATIERLAEQPDGPTIVYVTHHVEEILPLFTHALLLKDGCVLTSGEKKQSLTDCQLSTLFDMPLEVEWQKDRPWVKLV